MEYVIFDMEWNQALSSETMIRTPFSLYGEIIRIGAVKTDASFEMIDTFRVAIKPEYYKRMNHNVRRLTHIDNCDLQSGVSFATAVMDFRRWCGADCIFLTWGDNDVAMLRDNLRFFGLEDQWLPPYYNVQKIFDMQITRQRRAFALGKALEILGETGLLDHNAFYDAFDTYTVIRHLDMEKGINSLKDPCAAAYFVDNEWLDLEKICADSDSMRSDPALRRFVCKECGRTVQVEKWVSQCSGKVIALAHCEEGHSWFVRLNSTKHSDGSRFVRRMIYPLTRERSAVYEKYEEMSLRNTLKCHKKHRKRK